MDEIAEGDVVEAGAEDDADEGRVDNVRQVGRCLVSFAPKKSNAQLPASFELVAQLQLLSGFAELSLRFPTWW